MSPGFAIYVSGKDTFPSISVCIQLFQKTLSKEKQKAHKPRLRGNIGILKLANNAGTL